MVDAGQLCGDIEKEKLVSEVVGGEGDLQSSGLTSLAGRLRHSSQRPRKKDECMLGRGLRHSRREAGHSVPQFPPLVLGHLHG